MLPDIFESGQRLASISPSLGKMLLLRATVAIARCVEISEFRGKFSSQDGSAIRDFSIMSATEVIPKETSLNDDSIRFLSGRLRGK